MFPLAALLPFLVISVIPVSKANVSSYELFPTAIAADAFPMLVAKSALDTDMLFDFVLI